MRKFTKLLTLGSLLIGCAAFASASTIWTLNNVQFDRPGFGTNTATGTFTVDSSLASLDDWNITITGTNTQANAVYMPTGGGSSFNPSEAQFFFSPFTSQFLILDFAVPLTNAGGTVDLNSSSLACPGCGTLTSGTVSTGSVPEPSSGVLYVTGAGLIGIAFQRRKRVRFIYQ